MSDFRAPDLNAPRFRPDYKRTLSQKLFKQFIEKYPEYSHLDYEQFSLIVKTYNQKLWTGALDERDGIELPQSLGHVHIGACEKPFTDRVDYAKSKALGKKVMKRNMETDGKVAKIFYSNSSSRFSFRHKKLWAFHGGREFKRTLSRIFPERWTRYILKEQFKKDKIIKLNKILSFQEKIGKQKATEDYNEFDLE